MAEKLPNTILLPQPSPNLKDSLQALLRALFDAFTRILLRLNDSLQKDGNERMTAPLPLAQYATASLPAAADWAGSIVYDSTTNTVKKSNGTAWSNVP